MRLKQMRRRRVGAPERPASPPRRPVAEPPLLWKEMAPGPGTFELSKGMLK